VLTCKSALVLYSRQGRALSTKTTTRLRTVSQDSQGRLLCCGGGFVVNMQALQFSISEDKLVYVLAAPATTKQQGCRLARPGCI